MGALWRWVLEEKHRQLAGFVGAGLAALVAGGWSVFTYLHPAGDSGSAGHRAEAHRGGVAVAAGDNAQITVQARDPDVARVLDLLAEQQRQLLDQNSALVKQLGEKDEQLAALRKAQQEAAVGRVVADAKAPDAPPAAKSAYEALSKGDTRPAEARLREQEEAAAREGRASLRKAAQLAREQGALAFSHDTRAALAAYTRAAQYEPEDLYTLQMLGDLQVRVGDLPAAATTYATLLRLAETAARQAPGSSDRQRDLSVSHNKIGDVLVAQGDGPGALAAYRKGLDIREALAKRDPANTGWQRDLSVSHNKIGDVLVAQGDGPGALAAYRKGLAIAEALATRDPTNAEWQRDLIVSFVKLSETTGDKAFAGKALDVALAMRRRGILAPRDAWMIDDLKRRAGR